MKTSISSSFNSSPVCVAATITWNVWVELIKRLRSISFETNAKFSCSFRVHWNCFRHRFPNWPSSKKTSEIINRRFAWNDWNRWNGTATLFPSSAWSVWLETGQPRAGTIYRHSISFCLSQIRCNHRQSIFHFDRIKMTGIEWRNRRIQK